MAFVDLNAQYSLPASDDNDSKKSMVYTSDAGQLYIVNLSENIGEAFGFDDQTDVSIAVEMPKGFIMRKVTFSSASGFIAGSYPCGKPTTSIYAFGGTILVPRKGKASGVTVTVTGAQGERRRFLGANDTSQSSGDAS